MSNRRLSPNPSKPNCHRLSHRVRTVIAAMLLSSGVLSSGMIAWANGPAPGTIIENQATGSFVDPNDSSIQQLESNVVQVEVAEVAGITVTDNGYTEPNDGTVNEGDTVYVDFVLTNVGNDPTQFVIPGAASITNGTQAGSIQIIEYDADGTGAGAAVDLSGNNITVPGGGDTTGNLLNSVASANSGSVAAGGSITVRVPVTVSTAGLDLTVTLGDTAATDAQNETYVAGSNDVYTQDNSGTDNGDTAGAPINNEREAADSLTVTIAAITQTIDDTPSATSCAVQGGTLSGVNLFTPLDNGTMGFEDGSPDQSPDIDPYPGVVSGGNFVQYGSRSPGYGEYAYIANMQNGRNNAQHEGITDPVYGATGRFFVSDPNASTPTMTVTLTGLTPNQFYEYSFWAANAEPSQTSPNNNIDILIDGESVYSTGTLPAVQSALAWKKHTFTFTNGPNTSITVDLKSTETGPGGNDFNLDNIELQECNFAIDYGDAPSSYGDALHTTIPTTPTVYLGITEPDSETATPLGGDAGAGADGDDDTGDDEDAFTTPPDIPATGTYDLTNIPVNNTSGGDATLHAWIDFDQDGNFSAGEYQSTAVANGVTTANLSWSVPGGATVGDTYMRFRITQNQLIADDVATTDVDERSKDAVINGEVEDYQVAIVANNPNVLLVKRITAISNDTTTSDGVNLAIHNPTTYAYDDNDIPPVSDPNDPAYDETDPAFDPYETDQWPIPLNTYMPGGSDGGNVMPNDDIEYTIYFLSSGDASAENVLFCDYVPSFTTFIPNAYAGSTPQATGGIGGADLSIELYRNGTTDYHTGANDGDSATYFGPGIDPANSFLGIDCDGDGDGINANTNGAVVVNLGDLPDATSNATGAYGHVRFRTRVK